jgi:hypothetical protein
LIERGQAIKIQVHYGDQDTVRTLWQSGGNTILDLTLFRGLFELDRLDHGLRTLYRPKTDLAKLFPLSSGKQIKVEFEVDHGDKQQSFATLLKVNKADPMSIGACKYDVLTIDRSALQDGVPPRFAYSDYYSPALSFIIAKEFKSETGPNTLNKYDRISSLKNQ